MDPLTVSVIIPVLNEGPAINVQVENLYILGGWRQTEIVVVDGDAGGSTLDQITDTRPVRLTAPGGRAGQMNAGAAAASGGILLFLHVDTFLPLDGFELIRRAVAEGALAGAFELAISSRRPSLTVIAWTTTLRSRLTRVPFCDQAIFLRADYFKTLGGYALIPLMEDVELMRRIKRRGDAIRILPSKVHTSPRRWEQEGVLRCTLRNWILRLLYKLGASPGQLARYYR
jgi:rSAM/selenodomain-associated transferase 2